MTYLANSVDGEITIDDPELAWRVTRQMLALKHHVPASEIDKWDAQDVYDSIEYSKAVNLAMQDRKK